jgi:hypothetical protein
MDEMTSLNGVWKMEKLNALLDGFKEKLMEASQGPNTVMSIVSEMWDSLKKDPDLKGFVFDEKKYPPLRFTIGRDELDGDFIDKNGKLLLQEYMNNREPSVLERLLYSEIWKQGGISKVQHIANGILASSNEGNGHGKSLSAEVFYRFGRHIADKSNPIIDQHTIRAFLLMREGDLKNNAIEIINKTSKSGYKIPRSTADEYCIWAQETIREAQTNYILALSLLDKVMFSIGKYAKSLNNNK